MERTGEDFLVVVIEEDFLLLFLGEARCLAPFGEEAWLGDLRGDTGGRLVDDMYLSLDAPPNKEALAAFFSCFLVLLIKRLLSLPRSRGLSVGAEEGRLSRGSKSGYADEERGRLSKVEYVLKEVLWVGIRCGFKGKRGCVCVYIRIETNTE